MNQIHTPKTVLNRMNYTKGDPDNTIPPKDQVFVIVPK